MIARYNNPAMGLIVLRVDETIEHEFRQFIPQDTARLHITRINSGDDLTPDSIAQMEKGLTDAAALLPPAADFDVVGYACTSGTALLGADHVAALVKAGVPTKAVTDPLTATVAEIKARGLSRVGLVSPYLPAVAHGLVAAFKAQGVTFADTISMVEREEAKVARIAEATTAQAARALAANAKLDGIFLSCTNLNTAEMLAPLSAELGMPVLSSNQVLAAQMTALCGI